MNKVLRMVLYLRRTIMESKKKAIWSYAYCKPNAYRTCEPVTGDAVTPDITRMVDTLVSAWTLDSSRPHSLFRRAPVVVVVILTHAHKRRYPQRPP